MAYVKQTLAPGEEYLYRAHFNWTYDVRSWFWALFGAIPSMLWVYGAAPSYFSHDPFGHAFLYSAGAALMLGAILCLRRYIHKWTTVIAVTSLRLILKTGLIARATHEVYGVLRVRGTGDAIIEFPVLGAPMRVRREIEAAIMRARGGGKLS